MRSGSRCLGREVWSVHRKSVAIVGYGAVGRYLHRLFPEAVVYDEPLGMGDREEVNRSQFAFVAVPTNGRPDGSGDTSIVDATVSWLTTDVIVIRSTVPVGTTERLQSDAGKRAVVQPDYGPA